jgi:hypothetical protein
MTPCDRRADIERVVRLISGRMLERGLTVTQVVATLAAAGEEPREAAAAHRDRRDEMMKELDRFEQEGRGRAAASLVARKFVNRFDPTAVESLARKLRRWRSKKTDVSV